MRPTRHGRLFAGLAGLALGAVVLPGCSAGTDRAGTLAEPQATAAVALPSASAPVLEPGIAPTSAAPAEASAPAAQRCSIGAPTPDGSITVIVGSRLLAVDGTCMADLGADGADRVAWSPDGTRALLDGDRVLDASGVRPSGFLRDNPDVEWSGPKGTSLLAATSTGTLVKRSSDDPSKRTEVAFLARHDSSTYHPAGTAIVSLGIGAEEGSDMLGVWLADNRGAEARLLVRDESAAVISEPGFDASGTALYFLAEHDGGVSHVHAYDTTTAQLGEALTTEGMLSALTVSALSDRAWAVRKGGCQSGERPTVVADFGLGIGPRDLRDLPGLASAALEPAGWLPERRLLVLARPACDEPGTLWEVSPEGLPVARATGVDGAAARTVRGIPEDLSIPIDAQVVAR
jgi:hypothetical protein